MPLNIVAPPYPVFTDRDGTPLENGYVYLGEPGKDPETNPVPVFWDTALTIPAVQPIRTVYGYLSRNGTPAKLYANDTVSITVKNDKQNVVFSSLTNIPFDPSTSARIEVEKFTGDGVQTAFVLTSAPVSENNTQAYIKGVYQEKDGYSISGNTLTFTQAPPVNATIEVVTFETYTIGQTDASFVSYTPAGVGAVQTTVQTKLRETVSVKDFGAVGDGVTDDTAAIQAAIDTGANIYFPFTTSGYKTTATLNLSTFNQVLYSDPNKVGNRPKIFLDPAAAVTNVFTIDAASVTFDGLTIVGQGRTVTGAKGIRAARASGVADIDLYITNCTIDGCHVAVDIVGRGLTTQNSSYTDNRLCFNLDWPSPFVPGANPDQTAISGMRVYVIQNCRFHAMSGYYIIENIGANAENIHGVQFTNNHIDTLAAIYNGQLHDSVISGNVVINCNQVSFGTFLLTGASDSIISNNMFYGMDDNGSGTTYELLFGVSLTNAARIQITNNQFNRVKSDVIRIGTGCSNIVINGNIMKNVCLDNATSSTGRSPVRISGNISGLSFCDNIIETTSMTYNTSILQSTGGFSIEKHNVRGNIFNIADWDLTNFSDASVNDRLSTDNELTRYNGNGAATQTITFPFKPYVAILCNMTSGSNDMVMITSKSTAGSAYGDIDGYNVIVTGNFNINLAQYCIYAFA